jgi:hypothetical protein
MIELRQYCYIVIVGFILFLFNFPLTSFIFMAGGLMIFEEEDLDELEGEGEIAEMDK